MVQQERKKRLEFGERERERIQKRKKKKEFIKNSCLFSKIVLVLTRTLCFKRASKFSSCNSPMGPTLLSLHPHLVLLSLLPFYFLLLLLFPSLQKQRRGQPLSLSLSKAVFFLLGFWVCLKFEKQRGRKKKKKKNMKVFWWRKRKLPSLIFWML